MMIKNPKDNKKNSNIKKFFYNFILTFAVTLFILSFIFTNFTPNVDVQIGDSSGNDEVQEKLQENQEIGKVDKRLKWIQMEDNQIGFFKNNPDLDKKDIEEQSSSANDLQPPIDPSIYHSKVDKDTINSENSSEEISNSEDDIYLKLKKDNAENKQQLAKDKTKMQAPKPTPSSVQLSQNNTTDNNLNKKASFSKVYVGGYGDINHAIDVQNKITDSNFRVAPFIKQKNGQYIVQAGSFASKQKAQELVEKLSSIGMSAFIQEE